MGRPRGALAVAAASAMAMVVAGCQPQQPWQNELVSRNAAGTDSANGRSVDADLSPDGTKVVFTSEADDLGPHDGPGGPSAARSTATSTSAT